MIKAAAATGVTAFRSLASRTGGTPEPAIIDPLVTALEAEVARLRSELEETQSELVSAIAEAREEGAREVVLDHEAHLGAIEMALGEAQALWKERLKGAEELAISIARTALRRLFDEHRDLAELVERSIVTSIRRLDTSAVIKLRVSIVDFPDTNCLAGLARKSGLCENIVIGDPGLASGKARVSLDLGDVDLDLTMQRRELDALFAKPVSAREAA